MKKCIKYFGILTIVAIFSVGCDQHPSLQKYYVDSNENAEFLKFDVPASLLSLKDDGSSEEVKQTLKSIKKVNFLAFQLKDTNKAEFKLEKQKVKEILKNPKYQELITIGSGKQSYTVKFLGEEDAIDEVIFFGSDKEKGFALVRVLGKNMNPSKMMTLAQELKFDRDDDSMKQLGSFMKNLNL